MERALIIITKESQEFEKYWNGNNNNKLNCSPIPLPLQITVNSSNKVIVISPKGFGVENSDKGFGEKIKLILEAISIDLTNYQIGFIVHGSNNFNINDSGLTNIIFRKSYSSTDGKEFCQSENGNFKTNQGNDERRTGVLDAFRDAYIFKEPKSSLEESFNNLWNFFLGNISQRSKVTLLHQCLGTSNTNELLNLRNQQLDNN